MISLSDIGHVLLRVADEEASERFYRDVLGIRIAEQDPEHCGVLMTLGDGIHTVDIAQHPTPRDTPGPRHGHLGLAHIAFKVANYAAFAVAAATAAVDPLRTFGTPVQAAGGINLCVPESCSEKALESKAPVLVHGS